MQDISIIIITEESLTYRLNDKRDKIQRSYSDCGAKVIRAVIKTRHVKRPLVFSLQRRTHQNTRVTSRINRQKTQLIKSADKTKYESLNANSLSV